MNKKSITMTGLNIQFPISELILSGEKTIETRTYPLPVKFIGVPLLLVETPGRSNKFKARATAIIVFGESFKYSSKTEFYRDFERHKVDQKSDWAWTKSGKWGWPIISIKAIRPTIVKQRGIKFRSNIPFET